jgi:hypothetical protein
MKTTELKRHNCAMNDGVQSCDCFVAGQKAENKAWLKGRRCRNCGKEFENTELTDTCHKCWEMN